MTSDIQHLERADAPRLAYRHRPGAGPTVVYLPGYWVPGLASGMEATKAQAIDFWAVANGRAFLRFDYRGCGASEGEFVDGTISLWTVDALAVIEAAAPGPVVLVGSSMGGWTALLAARALGERAAALVLIAPAPDFTQWDLVEKLTVKERASLARNGWFDRADTDLPTPTRYSRALIDDGPRQALMGGPIAYVGPVRILHGQADTTVPWARSLDLAAALTSADVQLTLVKDGDHRLSRDRDIALLTATLEALLSRCSAD